MADIKIKDMGEALQIDDNAAFPYTQDNGGQNTTFKAKITQIASKILEAISFNSLNTTQKKVIPAINEVKGSIPANSDFNLAGLSDTTINNPSANQILQYSSNKWQNKAFTLANLTDTTISSPSNGQILKYNGSKWINASITSEDKTSDITFNESVTGNTKAYLKNDVAYLTYQGEAKTHSSSETIFVLPSELRPQSTVFVPFVVNKDAFGALFIYSNGNATINQISDTTASGRIYFSVAYPIA